ncbi:MAG: hypothetical protein QM734_14230 [Cyclobacteriaceae bacterium]
MALITSNITITPMTPKSLKSVLYGAIIIFSSSCNKNETIYQNCYLTEYNSPDQSYKISIIYDDNNHITAYQQSFNGGGTNSYKVTSNGNGLITQIQISKVGQGFSGPTKWVYVYSNNLLSQRQYFYFQPTDTIVLIENYIHNSFNQINQIQRITGKTDSQGQVINPSYFYSIYSYPDSVTKNATSIVDYDGDSTGYKGTPISSLILTYDTNKNLGAFFPPLLPEMMNLNSPFSTNNIITSKSVIHTINGDEITNTVSYTYQYNSSGYPVSSTYSNSGNNLKYTYTYSCK